MKIKLLALLFLTSLGFSDTTTNRLGLTIPTIGSASWGQKINQDLAIIDSTVAAQGQSNTFTAPVTFASSVTWTALTNGSGQCLGINGGNQTVIVPCGTGSGGGSTNGTILPSGQFQLPFYSVSGTTTTLAGSPNITTNSGATTLTVTGNITGGSFSTRTGVIITPTAGNQGFVSIGANGAGNIAILAPLTVTGGYNIVLPPIQGAAGTVQTNDGAGNMTWVAPTVAGAGLLASTQTWTGANSYTSTATFGGGAITMNASGAANGMVVNTPIVMNALGLNQCLSTNGIGQIITTGGPCGSGGGGGSTGGTIVAAPQFQIPYYSVSGTTTTVAGNSILTTDGSTVVNILSGKSLRLFNQNNGFSSSISNPIASGAEEIAMTTNGGVLINPNTGIIAGVAGLVVGPTSGHSYGTFAVAGTSATGSSFSGFTSTNNVNTSTFWALPRQDGTNGQAIVTDGSTHLSFATISGGSGSGIVSPGTFTWVNNFGVNFSTATIPKLDSPVTIVQHQTNPTESDLYFSQFQNGYIGSIRQLFYGNALPNTFNAPLIIAQSSSTVGAATINLDGGGSVGVNGLQVQTTFYVSGNVQIGSGATASGASLAPVDGLYVKGAAILNSTTTVAALSFSGGGNAQFSNDGVNYYQIVGSSASATNGHLAVFSSSWSVVDGGVPGAGGSGVPSVNSNSNAAITSSVTFVNGANVTLTQAGNTISIAASGGGGGTPGGGSPQLQFNSTGTFAGVSGSYVTNSSITYSGALSVTTMSVISPGATSSNTPGSLVDIFSNTFASAKPLMSIGSNDVSDQFRVLNHFPVDMKNNGADIGCLELAGHNEGIGVEGGIFERCAANVGYQGIYISNAFTGEMDLITATTGNGGGGGTIYLQPNERTEVAISTYGVTISTGLTVISSVTVNGTLAVIATTTTANMALISTATIGGFGVDISTVGHLNVFNTASTRGPSITNGTGDASCSDVACTINASASPVTFTFAKPFTKVPVCIVTEQTDSVVNALSYSKTATALTITQTGLSGNLDVICIGRD